MQYQCGEHIQHFLLLIETNMGLKTLGTRVLWIETAQAIAKRLNAALDACTNLRTPQPGVHQSLAATPGAT